MEKPLGHYFQVQSPYYQAAQRNQKHLFLYPQGDGVRSEKAKQRDAPTLMTATTGVHLPMSV